MKIKVGDKVKIVAGKDRNREGKIKKVFPKLDKVLVEGMNKYKKHLKPRGERKPGGIVDIEKPLSVANVALICPSCKQATRVGYKSDNNKKKRRICKKCKTTIKEK